jgi:hypothetical protein
MTERVYKYLFIDKMNKTIAFGYEEQPDLLA